MITVLNEKEIEENKRRAIKLVKSLNRLAKETPLKILLRSNNVFGGVVYHVSRVPSKETPTGFRTVLHIITPEGKEATEYAEFFDGSKLESCIVLDFPDSPFVMTIRKAPTLSDKPEDVEWVILGSRAEYIAEMKYELSVKSQIIDDLEWLVDQRTKSLEQLKRHVSMLEEKVREYEKELNRLAQDKVDLEMTLRKLIVLVEKHMAGELEATAALREILSRAEMAGKYEVMGVKDRIDMILERDKEIRDKLQMMYSGDGAITDRKMAEIVESVKSFVEEKFNELKLEIEKMKAETNGSKAEEKGGV